MRLLKPFILPTRSHTPMTLPFGHLTGILLVTFWRLGPTIASHASGLAPAREQLLASTIDSTLAKQRQKLKGSSTGVMHVVNSAKRKNKKPRMRQMVLWIKPCLQRCRRCLCFLVLVVAMVQALVEDSCLALEAHPLALHRPLFPSHCLVDFQLLEHRRSILLVAFLLCRQDSHHLASIRVKLLK